MAAVTRRSSNMAVNLPKSLRDIGSMETQVGWFEGARYGATKYGPGMHVAYVAAIQEYGYAAGGIPPRSFMRTTAVEKRGAWIAVAENGARSMIVGNASPLDVMEGIGQQAEGDVRAKIASIQEPPLAEETVKARLRKLADGATIGNLTKPLVETGYMLASLTSAVKR